MREDIKMWLCISECDIVAGSTNIHYCGGEIIEESDSPNKDCFISVTAAQAKQLRNILKSIQKEKSYQEKQRLAIRLSHPRINWKAEQRLNGSILEARSMRARFNKLASEIAGKEIEVFWDCKIYDKRAW